VAWRAKEPAGADAQRHGACGGNGASRPLTGEAEREGRFLIFLLLKKVERNIVRSKDGWGYRRSSF
jgi:hypothetical protein